jgi:hypothetical protein
MRTSRGTVLLILALGFFNARADGQVSATWTESRGNYSNAANWSTLTVPSNGGGTFSNAVINGTGSDTITRDASGTIINSLANPPGTKPLYPEGRNHLAAGRYSTSTVDYD